MLITAKGTLELKLLDSGGAPAVATAPLAGIWRAGSWNHMAATWDQAAGELALFINRRNVGSATSVWRIALPAAAPETSTITIATLTDPGSGGKDGLDGEIDEVRC